MNDDAIIGYLRSRADVDAPADLVTRVMGAVEASGAPRSFTASYSPLAPVALAVVALILAASALVLIPRQPEVGPSPVPSASEAASQGTSKLDELEDAVTSATQRLASANAVFGTQTFEIGGYLASATWFDWRPTGDQVVITREDVDVSASWWSSPDGEPLSVGDRIATTVSVVVDGDYVFSRDGQWVPTLDAPAGPVSWATGMLSGEIAPLARLGSTESLTAREVRNADGTTTWRLESPADGMTVEWVIDPYGSLQSYLAAGDSLPIARDAGLFTPIHMRVRIDFSWGDDVGPIAIPDVSGPADPSTFGLPADFPLAPPDRAGEAVQVTSCQHPSGVYRVTLPDGWWTNRNDEAGADALRPTCTLFGPEAFATTTNAGALWPRGVAVAVNWVDGGCTGQYLALRSSEATTVDGLEATIFEYAWGTEGTESPGLYSYWIDLSEPGVECELGGRFITASTSIEMTGDYEANKTFLDAIMSSMEITPPLRSGPPG